MQAIFQQLREVQSATLAARTRLNDKTIGTQAKAGKLQVVRVTYNAKGRSTVTPVSDFMTHNEVINALNNLTA